MTPSGALLIGMLIAWESFASKHIYVCMSVHAIFFLLEFLGCSGLLPTCALLWGLVPFCFVTLNPSLPAAGVLAEKPLDT